MKKTLPTLDDTGWLQDPKLLAGKLFKYFKNSQYSQSTIYYGSITSFDKIVKEYYDNDDLLKEELESSLKTLYLRYYDKVDVEVTITEKKHDGDRKVVRIINIGLVLTKDKEIINLSNTIDFTIDDLDKERSIYE